MLFLSFSSVSLLYAQLQAHMMSHEMSNISGCYDILYLRHQQAMDNLSHSVCCCALQLFRQVCVCVCCVVCVNGIGQGKRDVMFYPEFINYDLQLGFKLPI